MRWDSISITVAYSLYSNMDTVREVKYDSYDKEGQPRLLAFPSLSLPLHTLFTTLISFYRHISIRYSYQLLLQLQQPLLQ